MITITGQNFPPKNILYVEIHRRPTLSPGPLALLSRLGLRSWKVRWEKGKAERAWGQWMGGRSRLSLGKDRRPWSHAYLSLLSQFFILYRYTDAEYEKTLWNVWRLGEILSWMTEKWKSTDKHDTGRRTHIESISDRNQRYQRRKWHDSVTELSVRVWLASKLCPRQSALD